MRVQLAGQGEVGPGGGPAGDLYVEIHERPHEVFTRDGDDLHCTVTLPMTAAALGTTLELPTLAGSEDLRHRARHPDRRRCARCAARACRGCARPAGSTARATSWCTSTSSPRRGWTRSRPSCCASSPQLRGEEQPDLGAGNRNGHGLFSRLRDSFGGR